MPARWVLEARTTCGLVTGLDDPDWDLWTQMRVGTCVLLFSLGLCPKDLEIKTVLNHGTVMVVYVLGASVFCLWRLRLAFFFISTVLYTY